jgi:hypothetical protein
VLGVAALSAGSYTLPLETASVDGRARALPLPYGVADMGSYVGHGFNPEAFRHVAFRVEVGGQDSNPDDTPRAWDSYLGRTRVDRARAYTQALQGIGVEASLGVYPDAGHGITPQMSEEALAFLQGVPARHAARFGFGPARAALSNGNLATAAPQRRRY